MARRGEAVGSAAGWLDRLMAKAARRALLVIVMVLSSLSWTAVSVGLSGQFRADLELSETSFLQLKNLGTTVSLSGETWRTSGRILWSGGELSLFDVTDDRTLGPLSIRSRTVFDPTIGFSHVGSTVRFEFQGLQCSNYLLLSHDPLLSYDQLMTRGSFGSVTVTSVSRVGLCPLVFRSMQTSGRWYIPDCNLHMDVGIAFNCENGFESFKLTARFPEIAFLSNETIETEWRSTLRFEEDQKDFSSSLRMRANRINACMTPYLQAIGNGPMFSLDAVEVYGWVIECAVEDAVELRLATSLDPARNGELTGNADYWEMWRLRGSVRSCCDRDLRWTVETYFAESGGGLFGRGSTTLSAEIPLADRMTIRLGTAFRELSPRWTLAFGIDLRF